MSCFWMLFPRLYHIKSWREEGQETGRNSLELPLNMSDDQGWILQSCCLDGLVARGGGSLQWGHPTLGVVEMRCSWVPSASVGPGRNLELRNNGTASSWALVPILQTTLTSFDPRFPCFPSSPLFFPYSLSSVTLPLTHSLSPFSPQPQCTSSPLTTSPLILLRQKGCRCPFPGCSSSGGAEATISRMPCPISPSLLLWQDQAVWSEGPLATTGITGWDFRAATRWWGATASQPSGKKFFAFFFFFS